MRSSRGSTIGMPPSNGSCPAGFAPRSATWVRGGTTCRSTAIRTRRPPRRWPTAANVSCLARRIRYPSWGRIRTRVNTARSSAHVLHGGRAEAVGGRPVVPGRLHIRECEGHVVRRADGHVGFRQRRGKRDGLVGSRSRVRARQLRRPPLARRQCRGCAAVGPERGRDRRRPRARVARGRRAEPGERAAVYAVHRIRSGG